MSRQALNDPAEIPVELDRWNWGAFFLNWIWGIGNSTWVALLALIPGINLIVLLVLGFRGSRWAWRNRAWRDVDHFRRTQRNWAIAGLISWVVVIGGTVSLFSSVVPLMKGTEPYKLSMALIEADPKVREALGGKVEAGWLVMGGVNVLADGGGQAQLSIPLTGPAGGGTGYVEATRNGGVWDLQLVIVRVEDSDVPIVLVNKRNVQVPNAPIDL